MDHLLIEVILYWRITMNANMLLELRRCIDWWTTSYYTEEELLWFYNEFLPNDDIPF